MNAVPAEASAMRIVARDDNLAADQWLALTPPRATKLRTLQEVVGSAVPVLLDLSVGSQFPCQRQMTVRNGIAEIPRWRIVPDQTTTNSKSKTWQSAVDGGILTTADALTTADTVASYLENDWYRDWGGLLAATRCAAVLSARSLGQGLGQSATTHPPRGSGACATRRDRGCAQRALDAGPDASDHELIGVSTRLTS